MCVMDYKYRVCPCLHPRCPQTNANDQIVYIDGRAHHLDYPFPYKYVEEGSKVCDLERYRTFNPCTPASSICRNFVPGFLHPEVIVADSPCLKCVSCFNMP
ncbi:unnamed protein product [Clonostachys rhizophaga]|uniref:Uncharacterized protein n=1 Tax=Clonostachys rhizophaga TaxID=160324 RepID=A0A9N9YEY8_9HYPO|nr:unnamed protein product [Clonostachys rhizophaga]